MRRPVLLTAPRRPAAPRAACAAALSAALLGGCVDAYTDAALGTPRGPTPEERAQADIDRAARDAVRGVDTTGFDAL